jgi:tetratricopeptide (TPR) repeat protein
MIRFPKKRGLKPGVTVLAFVFLFVSKVHADVIYLNDGNILIVDKAWVEGDEVKYQTSRGVRSVPKTNVRRIQAETPVDVPSPKKWVLGEVVGSPPANAGSGTASTSTLPAESREMLSRLRENLRSDPSNPRARGQLISALASIASLQMGQGDFPGAIVTLQEARTLDSRNLVILQNLAVIHLRSGGFKDAEEPLREALKINNTDQDFHYLLGEAYYGQEKLAQAIDEWTLGLALGPHPEMARARDKAQREIIEHNQLGALQSTHFILRYDRDISNQQLAQQILASLERLYAQLSREVVSRPPVTITVILYPDQQYFNITRAAGWSGALYDGKIRVPTKGLTVVTPELNAVLVHELTHAFLASLPANCPGWFNEGLAQLQENRSASSAKKALAELRETGRLIRLEDLQGSFVGFSADKAEIAYTESLSAMEFLVARFGRTSVRSILDLMAQNLNFENSLKKVLNQSLPEFETAWHRALLQ